MKQESPQRIKNAIDKLKAKAASLPRTSMLVSPSPTKAQKAAIEKRLTSIDNLVDQFRRGSPFSSKTKSSQSNELSASSEKLPGSIEDLEPAQNLIHITQQEQNEKQKEEENINYKIRKLDEEISIQKSNAKNYEKQKQKINDNIQKLDRRKQKLEGKLKTHSCSESDLRQIVRSADSIRNNDMNSNSTDTIMRDEHSEPGPMTVNFLPSKKSSSQSLISMETRSLEESENGEIKASNEILTELKLQKELYESGLKMINTAIADFETKKSELDGEIRNLHSEVFKSQKIIEQTEFDNAERLKQIMNEIHDDSDLQKMEHSRLQNDLDQCNYRSNERNNDLIERLEKMQDRIEALEIKQRKVETSNQRPILPGPLEKALELLMPIFAFFLFYYNRLVRGDKDSSFWLFGLSGVAISVIVLRYLTQRASTLTD
ncbi:Oidioi.mRNA.OKI2018_I69.XSR.g14174.t1.cds [Oikopleura dioica]|uniref:Oidioi.mRNA.OKI2018_I69.XSR.g14174.t1.cds n=1 Tax=Oikopleura dioica TaxID=34765 RepID=A0ABN7S908_OIKDI|nr:Oidioi.mRNA.OKI2018_I69.XSR.g14174.t1.cds [Oikopleura dioica]